MNKTKKVNITVLMTVYNGEKYLPCAIESVLAQKYAEFEFLIVDDASSDRSLEIIKSYQDPRIRIIQNSKNQGQTVSLNIGLREARGEYIGRIDADDIAFPHWLQSQVNFLKKSDGIDVLSARVVTFGEKASGKVYSSPFYREGILLKSIIKSPVNHSCALIRKISVLNVGGYDNNYKIAADYAVWITFLRQNKYIVSNPDVVMAIRRHSESESEKNKFTQTLNEFAEISRKHVQFLTGMNLTEKESLLMCRAHYDEGGLNEQDFIAAVEIHKKVYLSLRRDLNLKRERVNAWYKKQAFTFYLKRIYWHILHCNRLEARYAAQQCLKRLGFNLVIFGLYFFSFFPQMFLCFILKIYHFIHALTSKMFLSRYKECFKRTI